MWRTLAVGLATRLGQRKWDWKNLLVRFADAFSRASISEQFDALRADHATTHQAIPDAVSKFEGMVNRSAELMKQNQALLGELETYHNDRQARIQSLLDTQQTLIEAQREIGVLIKNINQRLDTIENYIDAADAPDAPEE